MWGGYVMKITIDLSKQFFDDDEWIRLKDFFEKDEIEDLKDDLEKIIPAALSEYKEMFVGRGFPSRADEIRQYRLFYLIKHYFGELPSESEVSAMFQETQSRSKSLIRLVLTRFRYDLKEEIDNALINAICSARPNNSEGNPAYHVTIQSDIIVEELNRVINKNAPRCLIVKKNPGTGRSYSISEDSYDKLREVYGLTDENCPSNDDSLIGEVEDD